MSRQQRKATADRVTGAAQSLSSWNRLAIKAAGARMHRKRGETWRRAALELDG